MAEKETITLNKNQYIMMKDALKALIIRAGGSVEFKFEELTNADNKTVQQRYLGDKNQTIGRWTFTIVDEEPPDEPVKI